MVRLHPFQNVYFNDLVMNLKGKPEGMRKNYELDYWSVSFKQGLEYILKTDNRTKIKVCGNTNPCFPLSNNIRVLPQKDKQRIIDFPLTNIPPDYFISNYRWASQGYNFKYTEVFNIIVYNSRIMSVWKIQ